MDGLRCKHRWGQNMHLPKPETKFVHQLLVTHSLRISCVKNHGSAAWMQLHTFCTLTYRAQFNFGCFLFFCIRNDLQNCIETTLRLRTLHAAVRPVHVIADTEEGDKTKNKLNFMQARLNRCRLFFFSFSNKRIAAEVCKFRFLFFVRRVLHFIY